MTVEFSKLLPRIEFLAQAFFRRQYACPHCCKCEAPIVARKYLAIRIRQCHYCSLYFTDPIYRTIFAENFYDTFYQAEGSTTSLPGEMELEHLKETSFRGSDKEFSDRIKVIRDVAPRADLLEIGSSWGYFLYQALGAGIDAVGVEISDTRRRFGVERLGVSIVKDMTELGSRKFGAVYTSHVLEHFTDLSTIFEQIRNVLVPEGMLFIEVPHFAFKHRGKEILKIIGAIHPLGFTADFFRHALPLYGFRIVGFFDSWEAVPFRPVEDVRQSSLILIARSGAGTI